MNLRSAIRHAAHKMSFELTISKDRIHLAQPQQRTIHIRRFVYATLQGNTLYIMVTSETQWLIYETVTMRVRWAVECRDLVALDTGDMLHIISKRSVVAPVLFNVSRLRTDMRNAALKMLSDDLQMPLDSVPFTNDILVCLTKCGGTIIIGALPRYARAFEIVLRCPARDQPI